MTAEVTIYGREGCCLCQEALEVVQRVQQRVPFHLHRRDIETDDRWLKNYLERIPVICINGEEAFELFVDEQALQDRLLALRGGSEPR